MKKANKNKKIFIIVKYIGLLNKFYNILIILVFWNYIII